MTAQQDYANILAMDSMLMEYRLDSILGVGGFGITYLARDTLLDKDVAIKEYFPSGQVVRTAEGSVTLVTSQMYEDYKGGLDRFLKEARTLAGFRHPHIVHVNRYFTANGSAYMVMDYEKGESLKSYLGHAPFPAENALKDLLAPLMDGIEKVHATGFLHRDIQPDNIFMRIDGGPVLIDFGSARQAAGGSAQNLTTIISPGYAPFEQYTTGTEQGPWTDLYALGGVLYFAVTGQNPPDALTRMKNDPLEEGLAEARKRYSGKFIDAIAWALTPDEARRPRNIAEWRQRLLDTPAGGATVQPESTAAVQPVTAPPSRTANPAASGNTVRTTGDIGSLLDEKDRLERLVHDKFSRVLTVMFTDLKGSTAMAESQGDIAVRGMLKRYFDLVGDAIKQNGGVLVKTIGDGTLSHFVLALGALRAAVIVQRGMEQMNLSHQFKTLLLARIGIHTGQCILEKDDIFGDVVNTASRFESSAKAGEILISEDTYLAVSDKSEIYCRFDREITLKGKSAPFKAYKAFWDPKEIEQDRVAPTAVSAKASTPAWKLAAMIGIPVILVLVVTLYVSMGERFGGEERRSVIHSLPTPSK